MKNHFYMPYVGNKRDEVKTIYEKLNFNNITTIVEPFCGSCAMSYYISTQKTGLEYVFNDNNEYLKEMYEIIIDDEKCKEFEQQINDAHKYIYSTDDDIDNMKKRYLELTKKKSLIAWFYGNKYYYFRVGVFDQNTVKFISGRSDLKLSSIPIYSFFRNNKIIFTSEDGLDVYIKYKNNINCMILIDPPYLETCNDNYMNASMGIYKYLSCNQINTDRATIVLILEKMWIIELLFGKIKYKYEYEKKYNGFKKKTVTHVIISNKTLN